MVKVWKGLDIDVLERDFNRALLLSRVIEASRLDMRVTDVSLSFEYTDDNKVVKNVYYIIRIDMSIFESSDLEFLQELASVFGFRIKDWHVSSFDEDKEDVEITLYLLSRGDGR